MSDWRVVYLRALGAKPTTANMDFLSKWQPWEGGATNNNARFNYFNTTEHMPGSSSINSVGVQSYRSLAQGALAFAKTLRGNANYAGLVNELRAGNGVGGGATAALSTWLSGDPHSSKGLAYAQKILGSAAKFTAPSPAGAPGGTQEPSPAPQVSVPLTTPDVTSQIHTAALGGLQAITQGQKPTDAFGDVAGLIHTLRASVPQVEPQTQTLATAAGPSSVEAKAVQLARKYIGVKYTYGGESPQTGFDCSGLLQTIWKQLGVNIPRTTYDQWDAGTPVKLKQLRLGDALFFTGSDPKNGKPGHVGIYIGNGRFIEAAHTGTNVRISNLAGRTDYVGARRYG